MLLSAEEEEDELADSGDDAQQQAPSSVQALSSPARGAPGRECCRKLLRDVRVFLTVSASTESASAGKKRLASDELEMELEGEGEGEMDEDESSEEESLAAQNGLTVGKKAKKEKTWDHVAAARRRKANIKLGAAGPGRGWRKGLRHGDKPVYTLPDGVDEPATPEQQAAILAQRAAAKADAAKQAAKDAKLAAPASSPAPAAGSSSKPKAAAPKPAPLAPKTAAAIAPAARKPSGSSKPRVVNVLYPAIPQQRHFVPVKNLAKIPMGFPPVAPLDRTKERQPREWVHMTREVLTIGGRVMNFKTYFGGADRGYHPEAEAEEAAAAAAAAAAGEEGDKSKGGSAAPADEDSAARAASGDGAAPSPAAPTFKIKLSKPQSHSASASATPAPSGEEPDWRGSSPAFALAGK